MRQLFHALLLSMFALRRMRVIKKKYLQSILNQEISWHDAQNSGEFASRISSDFKKFEAGINENMSILIYHVSACVISLVVGVYYGWKLSLAVLAVAPVVGASALIATKLQAMFSKKEMEANSKASSVAEEAIGAIRTVFAFSGQNVESRRYEEVIKPAMSAGCKRNLVAALDNSIGWAMMYVGLSIGVWYGVKLILDPGENYSVGDVVIIYWSITFCGYNIGYAAPYLESFKIARTAAAGIFKIIERNSVIDSSSKEGQRLGSNYKTNIELRNVCFKYPTRADVPVLQGINLKINSGEIVALVGSSGCGKSTIIQLIQRFYDPQAGEVLLDGTNIKELNVGWLRQQIGVVGQEPVLFNASIEENIRMGVALEQMNLITSEDIIRAAKEANAHEFITNLHDAYQTMVGQLLISGGQKQRIAIARALISQPKILLLDEATSALDLKSEQVVQAALDRASQGRTTIIVAHRLSTIINADRIIFIDSGKVLEMGTHEELMQRRSAYFNLVQAQQVTESSNAKRDKELDENVIMERKLTEQKELSVHKESIEDEERSDDKEKLKTVKTPHMRLLKLIWIDKALFLIAFTSSVIYGMGTPIYALIFGGFVDTFAESTDADFLHSQSTKYGLMFVGLALLVFAVNLLQIALFGIVGERLTMRLRNMAFSAILQQPISWFDQPQNSTGALCSRLADDAANVQGATGLRVALMCQALTGLVCSVVIGFVFNWRLALVSLGLMPIVAGASMLSGQLYSGQAKQDGKTSQTSGKILIEVMNAIRTVVSLHKQQFFFDKFSNSLNLHHTVIKAKVFWKSLLIGISLAAPFFAYSIAFCYGGYLLSNRYLKSGDFFRIAECMVFGAVIIGETTILSADYTKAKMAAFNIFALIDQKPGEKKSSMAMSNNAKTRSDGNISFRGVLFNYPSRPNTAVLNGLSFSASKGQTVALVGQSGCGKSTSIQLLEQFYDYNGQIQLDNRDIASMNTDWVRSQIALVSQEPVLFSYSIKDNIAYGDNSRKVSFDEIVKAAQMANVHDFVKNLPQGYDTPVGSKGSGLSGGQKQRIAIARALVRDPPILLLDEATSALDTASEKVVQSALDEASKGRTCLVIAHRLKTIVNAHKIVVIHKGQNVEEGTHEELLARKGHYWGLYNSAISN